MEHSMGIRICGTGSCVPQQIVSNEQMEHIVDTSDEWIQTRTGITERHIADEETNLQLTSAAADCAIEMAGIQKKQIGVVICATLTGDTLVPSLACLLQRECGLPENILAFDMSAACSGFLYALHTARALLKAMPERQYALITGSEILSRITNYQDRSTCVLFGDGAGAAVIRLDADAAYAFDCGAQGNTEDLYCPRSYALPNPFKQSVAPEAQQLHMNGAVYAFAVHAMADSISRLLKKTGILPQKYICHQANERILQAAAKFLHEPEEKFYRNIARYGNTSAASVPIALDECVRQGVIHRGDAIVLSGFGGGLTFGSAFLTF